MQEQRGWRRLQDRHHKACIGIASTRGDKTGHAETRHDQLGREFDNDMGRREWHERKMRIKLSRAKRQLELLNLDSSGIVMHC
ncbi:hypothetical protein ACHAW5_002196 [Stephanodiscus triporus]|uniref:Uncharacterized protein n=1 Tax=Stephanodiscus triporus TaxID=2934178 RepID=A0ABD3MRY8_9STRA